MTASFKVISCTHSSRFPFSNFAKMVSEYEKKRQETIQKVSTEPLSAPNHSNESILEQGAFNFFGIG